MKAAIVLVGVIAVFGAALASPSELELDLEVPIADPYQARIFEGLINSTINSVVAVLAQFDPVVLETEQQAILGHQGEITNLRVEGFSNIVATRISLGGLITWTLRLTLVAPRIAGSVENWKVDGEQFYGDGSANVEINDLQISVTAKINPITMNIKDVQITPSIGQADVSITGILNDEEKSQQISDFISTLLNDVINNNTDLHDKISDALHGILQSILDGLY